MIPTLIMLLQGICVLAAWAIGLVFLRFWRDTGDRLFLYFAMAFWLLSASWALLGVFNPEAENRPYVYGIRLTAFLVIIAGIVDKNRGAAR